MAEGKARAGELRREAAHRGDDAVRRRALARALERLLHERVDGEALLRGRVDHGQDRGDRARIEARGELGPRITRLRLGRPRDGEGRRDREGGEREDVSERPDLHDCTPATVTIEAGVPKSSAGASGAAGSGITRVPSTTTRCPGRTCDHAPGATTAGTPPAR